MSISRSSLTTFLYYIFPFGSPIHLRLISTLVTPTPSYPTPHTHSLSFTISSHIQSSSYLHHLPISRPLCLLPSFILHAQPPSPHLSSYPIISIPPFIISLPSHFPSTFSHSRSFRPPLPSPTIISHRHLPTSLSPLVSLHSYLPTLHLPLFLHPSPHFPPHLTHTQAGASVCFPLGLTPCRSWLAVRRGSREDAVPLPCWV